MSFDGWLDARDSATVEREWAALGAKQVQVGEAFSPRYLSVQPHGAALLAAAFLGCSPDRFAWFAADRNDAAEKWPVPTYRDGRAVTRSFLDGDFEVQQEDCHESWQIRETVEGTRGVQHIVVDCTWGPMTREGGEGRSSTVVRIFDRSTRRAVSIPLWSTSVWTIGDIDLAPLDLFSHRVGYKLRWSHLELAAVRGFVAQVTADLDAHFDTSPEWEGGVSRDEILESEEYNFRTRRREFRFASGPYAIELGENLDPDVPDDPSGMLYVQVHGLPWGHQVNIRIALAGEPPPPDFPVDGWIDFRLPRQQLDACIARVAKIPGIQLA